MGQQHAAFFMLRCDRTSVLLTRSQHRLHSFVSVAAERLWQRFTTNTAN